MLITPDLREAIEENYAAFAEFEAPRRLDTDRDGRAILRDLRSAPLRELSPDALGQYAGWAMTTVGTERDYRHFLPLILELSTSPQPWLGFDATLIASKLEYGLWRTWPSNQQSAIRAFFSAAFQAAILIHPEISLGVDDWAAAAVGLGLPPTELFRLWRSANSLTAALHLGSLVTSQRNCLVRDAIVKGPRWDQIDEPTRRDVARTLLSRDNAEYIIAARELADPEDDAIYLVGAVLQ